MKDFLREYTNKVFQERERVFEDIIRTHAQPPIKGPITAAKLRYRGIKQMVETSKNRCWLTQKGVQIGPIFEDRVCIGEGMPDTTVL